MGTEKGLLRQILRFGPIADEAEDIAVDPRVVLTELDSRLRPYGWKGLCHRDASIAPRRRASIRVCPASVAGVFRSGRGRRRQRGHRAVLGAPRDQMRRRLREAHVNALTTSDSPLDWGIIAAARAVGEA